VPKWCRNCSQDVRHSPVDSGFADAIIRVATDCAGSHNRQNHSNLAPGTKVTRPRAVGVASVVNCRWAANVARGELTRRQGSDLQTLRCAEGVLPPNETLQSLGRALGTNSDKSRGHKKCVDRVSSWA